MKCLIRLLLLSLPIAAAAQSSLPPCPSDTRLLWTNCAGQLHFNSGEKYYGTFNNGAFHGEGVFIHADGRRYVGELKGGKRDGQGIEYRADGTIIRSGQWASGDLVQSFALDRSRFPFNTSTHPVVAAAQSQLPPCPANVYKHNCFGAETITNGRKYVGEYKDGKFHGQGTYTWASGEKYVGEFKGNKFHGQGTYTWASGDKYVGEYKDDKRNGLGTLTWANREKYVGEWRDDFRNGQGIEYRADGTINRSGQWAAGDLVQSFALDGSRFPFNAPTQPVVAAAQSQLPPCPATGVIRDCQGATRFLNGDRYQGEWRAGKRNGQGTYTSANGNTYVGEFSDNNHDGWGRLTFANGDVYVGEWVQGRRHGQGVEFASDGLVRRSGQWRAGQLAASYPLPVDRFSFQPASTVSVEAQQRSAAALSSPAIAQASGQAEPPRSTLTLSATASQPDANGVVILEVTTNTATASLKINGDEAGGRADGRYFVNRFARVGSNSYEVIATDQFGNTTKRTVVVNREIKVEAERVRSLNPTLISAPQPRDAVAIIIGIEKYRRVPDADFANNDARAFYDYARLALGIRPENIRLLVDDKADAAEILRAFKTWLPPRVNKNTTDVYVFFSGHGLPSEDGGKLYFLPHEVDRDLLDRTAITQKEVVQEIQRTAPKSVTMFIDSCYSGQSRTGTSLLANARPISIAPKASSDFPPNVMVISASAPDQISSSSPELKHGIFSYYLMLGMEGEADLNKDGQITVGEMQTYLSQRVSRRASGMNRAQSPQTTGDLNHVLVQVRSKTR